MLDVYIALQYCLALVNGQSLESPLVKELCWLLDIRILEMFHLPHLYITMDKSVCLIYKCKGKKSYGLSIYWPSEYIYVIFTFCSEYEIRVLDSTATLANAHRAVGGIK